MSDKESDEFSFTTPSLEALQPRSGEFVAYQAPPKSHGIVWVEREMYDWMITLISKRQQLL